MITEEFALGNLNLFAQTPSISSKVKQIVQISPFGMSVAARRQPPSPNNGGGPVHPADTRQTTYSGGDTGGREARAPIRR